MKTIDEEKKKIAGFFWSTFKSHEGQWVLNHLREKFASGTPFSAESDRITSFFCGQQDVIHYLNDMVKGARLPEENGDNSTYLEEGDDV